MTNKSGEDIKYLTQKELKKFFNTIEKEKNAKFYKRTKYGYKYEINKHNFWLRDLTMFNIAYLCGMRASEIGLVKLENYNKHTGEIFVKRLKGSMNNTIKLDKKRMNLLNKYIREHSEGRLFDIKGEYDFLFKSSNGKQLNFNTIYYIFKKYANKTNVDKSKLHPHCLKHSIAVHLAESGIDVKDLQYYLGHKSILNTQIYFQYTTRQLDSMYEKLEKNCMIV